MVRFEPYHPRWTCHHIIVGGRRAFSYEFFPKNSMTGTNMDVYQLSFLRETIDPKEDNNLYPFLHILPDGGEEELSSDWLVGVASDQSPEVMICGGAHSESYIKAEEGLYVETSKTCGRLKPTDPEPQWSMEEMPMGRVMLGMLSLPNSDIVILNGASKGAAGWEHAIDPVLNPVLYKPNEPVQVKRFAVLNPTTIPRMYHSAATLLPDGRILVGESNPHVQYNFTGVKDPSELSLEAFLPHFLGPQYSHLRPSTLLVEGSTSDCVSNGQKFSITFALGLIGGDRGFTVTMVAPSFTTHSVAMIQRLLVLDIVEVQ
ncbi:unnamed protein product [Ilex paraguariensis]|uniref:Uncharacterized protein n=1 Tax=Ilex paraguariensis TaxID=185542 RepID=A0ABC8TRY4_9AQUA